MKNFISQIDTERFGFKIARIDDLNTLYSKNVLNHAKNYGIKLLISRIPAENIKMLEYFTDQGFYLMDTQSKYRFDINPDFIDLSKINEDIIIRTANQTDQEELIQISKESFDNYGHYFANKKLNRKHCNEIYQNWTIRTLTEKNVADKVLVASFNNKVIGYLSLKISEKNQINYAIGLIGAVALKYRSKNVFSSLMLTSIQWAKSENLKWIDTNALNYNYPILKVLSKTGFYTIKSYITLHKWV